MGSVLFLAAWSVMMGPIQYGEQAFIVSGCALARLLHSLTKLQSSISSLARDFRSLPLILEVLHSHSTFLLV
jgi:hypothetical protein